MRLCIVYTILLCLCTISDCFGQSGIHIEDSSSKIQKKYAEILKSIRSGDSDKALKSCNKLIAKHPELIELYVRRGSIYFSRKNYFLAELDFQKVFSLDTGFDSRLRHTLALSQYHQEKYEQASSNFDYFLQSKPKEGKRKSKAEKLLQNAQFAIQAMQEPVDFTPVLLGEWINTSYSEYYPVFSMDHTKVIFTRNIKGQEDFYYCELEDSISTFCQELDALNTPQNEGVHCLSPDGNTIIFTSCHNRDSYGSCDLFYSSYIDGSWTRPRNLGPEVNSKAWDAQPSWSGDGQELYFSSKRRGGHGGSDIYRSRKDKTGKWSKAENLGPLINTNGDDESPFIHTDHQTLYLRSNGRPGMGSFDIYKSQRNFQDRKWKEPINLGYPVNTKYNNGALHVNPAGTEAYFASDRAYVDDEDNKNLDIYKFTLDPQIAPIPSTYVSMEVMDRESKALLIAQISLIDTRTQQEIIQIKSNISKKTIFSVPVGADYALVVSKEGYIYSSDHISLGGLTTAGDPYHYTVMLEKLQDQDIAQKPTQPIILNNIFFESGQSRLLEKSNIEINYLASLLKDNVQMKIKIVGHTDNVGDMNDNKLLSQKRAQSVVNALISRGVEAQRLQSEGMGESSPISSNDTEQGRRMNRRTEFLIL